jgi:uncharacterized NAD-dependent epimerase/dehydratase family protein
MDLVTQAELPRPMEAPYLLFLGDATILAAAKTAAGLKEWRGALCRGQWSIEGCGIDLGLPHMNPAEAVRAGVKTMVIGIANPGGFIAPEWEPAIAEAIEAGLDVAAGLHQRLSETPAIAEAAKRCGRRLIDCRHSGLTFPTGTGRKRTGKRVLTVGTDCVVGKKYTALALEKALTDLGVKADFRATGQTGVMIAGRGVAIDAVVSDFVAGAAEWLSPDNDPDHWDVIEGQGSLFHPAYAGVTLGLLHGSQPDALIVCHEPVRTHILSVQGYPVPPLGEFIAANRIAARLTNPNAIVAGVSINTGRMSAEECDRAMHEIEDATGLPCCDPIRHGAGKLAQSLLAKVP